MTPFTEKAQFPFRKKSRTGNGRPRSRSEPTAPISDPDNPSLRTGRPPCSPSSPSPPRSSC
ncbi:hypothetical protein D779_3837 [Imhoffiella purpurea]|uniref:Uncharacterized protein n=1 Tax=Imhoffiella purpurea TaxID=1249627 RepID=W9VSN0_9GAMM|nr:hypothetical protein D779_3837 [Imhoffiella purpurea]